MAGKQLPVLLDESVRRTHHDMRLWTDHLHARIAIADDGDGQSLGEVGRRILI